MRRRWFLGAVLWSGARLASRAAHDGAAVAADDDAEGAVVGTTWFSVRDGEPEERAVRAVCVAPRGAGELAGCEEVVFREKKGDEEAEVGRFVWTGICGEARRCASGRGCDPRQTRTFTRINALEEEYLHFDSRQGWWVVDGLKCEASDAPSLAVGDDVVLAGFEDWVLRRSRAVIRATGLVLDTSSTLGSGRVRLQLALNNVPSRLFEQAAAQYLASAETRAAKDLLEVGLDAVAPRSAVMAALHAEASWVEGAYEASLALDDRAIEFAPRDAELHVLRADHLRRVGHLADAADAYATAAALEHQRSSSSQSRTIEVGWWLDGIISAHTILKKPGRVSALAERCRAAAFSVREARDRVDRSDRAFAKARRVHWSDPQKIIRAHTTPPSAGVLDDVVLDCVFDAETVKQQRLGNCDWITLLRITPPPEGGGAPLSPASGAVGRRLESHRPHVADEVTGFFALQADRPCPTGPLYESEDCFAALRATTDEAPTRCSLLHDHGSEWLASAGDLARARWLVSATARTCEDLRNNPLLVGEPVLDDEGRPRRFFATVRGEGHPLKSKSSSFFTTLFFPAAFTKTTDQTSGRRCMVLMVGIMTIVALSYLNARRRPPAVGASRGVDILRNEATASPSAAQRSGPRRRKNPPPSKSPMQSPRHADGTSTVATALSTRISIIPSTTTTTPTGTSTPRRKATPRTRRQRPTADNNKAQDGESAAGGAPPPPRVVVDPPAPIVVQGAPSSSEDDAERFRSPRATPPRKIHLTEAPAPGEAAAASSLAAASPLKEVLADVDDLLDDVATHQDAVESRLEEHRATLDSLRAVLTNIPESFVCPISCDVIKDPVFAADGHTYERACIEAWFAQGKATSPTTNVRLPHTQLTPNHAMRSQIASFLDECRKVAPALFLADDAQQNAADAPEKTTATTTHDSDGAAAAPDSSRRENNNARLDNPRHHPTTAPAAHPPPSSPSSSSSSSSPSSPSPSSSSSLR